MLFVRSLRSRHHLLLENLALSQQLSVLARTSPAATIFQCRSIPLGYFAACLVEMARIPDPRSTRDSYRLKQSQRKR